MPTSDHSHDPSEVHFERVDPAHEGRPIRRRTVLKFGTAATILAGGSLAFGLAERATAADDQQRLANLNLEVTALRNSEAGLRVDHAGQYLLTYALLDTPSNFLTNGHTFITEGRGDAIQQIAYDIQNSSSLRYDPMAAYGYALAAIAQVGARHNPELYTSKSPPLVYDAVTALGLAIPPEFAHTPIPNSYPTAMQVLYDTSLYWDSISADLQVAGGMEQTDRWNMVMAGLQLDRRTARAKSTDLPPFGIAGGVVDNLAAVRDGTFANVIASKGVEYLYKAPVTLPNTG